MSLINSPAGCRVKMNTRGRTEGKRKLLPLELRKGKMGRMKIRTKNNQGSSTKTLRRELLQKKAALLVTLGINSKRLADVERTSEEDAITVVNDEFFS